MSTIHPALSEESLLLISPALTSLSRAGPGTMRMYVVKEKLVSLGAKLEKPQGPKGS